MHFKLLILSVLLSTFAANAADLELAPLFRDGAIFQRDRPLPVWGRGEPDQPIKVTFGDQELSTRSDQNGKWLVTLDSLGASKEPRTLTVESGGSELHIANILVGEVWLCSGQSNMAMRVDLARDPEKEKAAADLPNLRIFTVGRNALSTPADRCEGEWIASSSETAGRFSAAAFFFGRELHEKLDVPVGLIVSAWSGSAIEAWTSREAQEKETALDALRKSWNEKDAAYTPEIEAAEKTKYAADFAEWKAASKAAIASGIDRPRAPRRPINPRFHHHHPDGLFNGMISPLIPFGIRGVIWYQGETNGFTEESSALYEIQLPALIKDWRARWNQGDFPMAWIQLPWSSANRLAWPRIRESMRRVSEAVPNTGMAITIDLGEERNLHPKNKQGFAHRLALWARAEVYGEKIEWSGPLYSNVSLKEGNIVIDFKHCSGGLTAKSGEPKGFEISGGQDGDWKTAGAKIEGKRVIVNADSNSIPAAVRYAWANHPDGNLFNGAGLPASPFEFSFTQLQLPVPVKKQTRAATPPPTKPPLEPAGIANLPEGVEQFEIFLLLGQSNMKGRGAMPEEPLRNPRILMMHKPSDGWFLARHPLHLTGDATTFQGHDNAGVGPGLAFGQAIAKARPKSGIALIPCAAGGTRIGLWAKGKPLYENAIRKAKLALEQGPSGKCRIAGALWLQGESDSNTPERISAYPEALAGLVDNLRADLAIPELPFIATTIGEMRAEIEGRKKINAILLDLPNQRPRTDCVDGRDLKGHIGDFVHFDTAAQNEIGRRFASAWLKHFSE